MSGHARRAGARTCEEGACQKMRGGQVSEHARRAGVKTCEKGGCQDMRGAQASGHARRTGVRTHPTREECGRKDRASGCAEPPLRPHNPQTDHAHAVDDAKGDRRAKVLKVGVAFEPQRCRRGRVDRADQGRGRQVDVRAPTLKEKRPRTRVICGACKLGQHLDRTAPAGACAHTFYLQRASVRVSVRRSNDEVGKAIAIGIGAKEDLAKVGVLEPVIAVRVELGLQLRHRDGHVLRAGITRWAKTNQRLATAA